MKERIAFDTSLYFSSGAALAVNDLTCYALELKKKVTPYLYCETPDGSVVAPNFGNKRIEEILVWETPQDKQASEASLKSRDIILAHKTPFITVWISSADARYGYERGSMVVGFGRQENGLNVVENFGITTKTTPEQDLEIAKKLLQYSREQQDLQITTNDELRAVTLCLKPPKGSDMLEFISEFIPFNDIWEKIKNGEAQKEKEEEQKKAARVVKKYKEQLGQAKTREEHIAVGAAMERDMGISGYSDSGCGSTNSELLSGMSVYSYSYTTIGENGNSTLVHSELGVFCRECPFCHRTINATIYPGYKCTCGQVFTGACGGGGQSVASDTEETIEKNPLFDLFGLLFSFILNL